MKKIIFFLTFALTPFLVFSDDENTGGIEEVIVTAERQASSIQDTAISITAFDSTLIEALTKKPGRFTELYSCYNYSTL